MHKDFQKRYVLSLSILFLVFIPLYAYAYGTVLSVHITPEGVIEPFSVVCTGTNAEAYLIHGTYPFYKSVGVFERRPCRDGVAHFDAYDLNAYLQNSGGSDWIRYYALPQELVVKDTTGLYSPDETYMYPINLAGAFNFYDQSVMDPENTYWPTLGAGSSFTFDGAVWKNENFGIEECCSNVLFIPGIEASRLYKPGDKLWEPLANNDVQDLYLDESGKSMRDDVYTEDVIDEAYGTFNIYKSFLADLNMLKNDYHVINDYTAIPYDWRLSLDDIVSNGTLRDGKINYVEATSTPYIIQELTRLASNSKTGKVTLIAHSNGGLVVKALIKKLTDSSDPLVNKIDKIIFVAVPQLGTPAALAVDLHGYKQGIPAAFPLVLSPHVARGFAANSPMAYNLLPSQKYFDVVSTPVITFDPLDSDLHDWKNRYGDVISTSLNMSVFLRDTSGKTYATSSDILTPSTINNNLYANAQTTHVNMDTRVFPSSIKLYEIAGWGIPSTISGIHYSHENGVLTPHPLFTIDGDGTVVVPSALWSMDGNVEKYWVDLYSYNKLINRIVNLKLVTSHADILEIKELRELINYIILGEPHNLPDYIGTSTPQVSSIYNRMEYSLHSPLTLNLYDDQGNHTGVSTSTGAIEEGIPGSYYVEFGDVKYVFTDTLTPVHVIMDGYADGTFTFNINQFHGDTLFASTTFKDIPTTSHTKVTLDVTHDINTVSNMSIDNNSDGNADVVITPKLNDVVTAPVSKIPLTVEANNMTIIVGSQIPTLSPTISGYAQGDSASTVFSELPVCTTTATSQSKVGTYPITCVGGVLTTGIYELKNYIHGTLNVAYRWGGFLFSSEDKEEKGNHKDKDKEYNKRKKDEEKTREKDNAENIFKAGSTISVSFQIKKSNGTIIQSSELPVWLVPQKGTSLKTPPDDSVYINPGLSTLVFTWQPEEKQYIYRWNTKGLTGGYWYKIFVKLDDGTIHTVNIGLK